ncbi:hypothetical protein PUN28_019728 [Cardiocondyla obscurior]|uniref:Uncharacterized protein n=1 Tax=Cardiocondyla obscurior TaxID=286306 RepID=A0AAW2EC55_9HYME
MVSVIFSKFPFTYTPAIFHFTLPLPIFIPNILFFSSNSISFSPFRFSFHPNIILPIALPFLFFFFATLHNHSYPFGRLILILSYPLSCNHVLHINTTFHSSTLHQKSLSFFSNPATLQKPIFIILSFLTISFSFSLFPFLSVSFFFAYYYPPSLSLPSFKNLYYLYLLSLSLTLLSFPPDFLSLPIFFNSSLKSSHIQNSLFIHNFLFPILTCFPSLLNFSASVFIIHSTFLSYSVKSSPNYFDLSFNFSFPFISSTLSIKFSSFIHTIPYPPYPYNSKSFLPTLLMPLFSLL